MAGRFFFCHCVGGCHADKPQRIPGVTDACYPGPQGVTTITNSGAEIDTPYRNVSRTIIISISICAMLYVLVVASSLTLPESIKARDFDLAEAERMAFDDFSLWFTVALAIVATASGVIASVFAVSRVLAMLILSVGT